MLKNIIITFILLISVKSSYSQFEITEIGARPIALGGAFTALADNSNAVYYNPSGLSQLKFREISVFYSPLPFGLKELAYGAVSYIEPTKLGAFGLSFKTYGFELYRELTGTISYSNNYKNKFYYGVNLNYYNLNIKNYGSAYTFGADAGAIAYLTEQIRWGFSVMNVTRSAIGESKEKLPTLYRTGIYYKLHDELGLMINAEKDIRLPLSFNAGIEYKLMNYLELRAGVGSEPTKFSAGVGFKYSLFQIDYALFTHQDLGLTHQGSISINFGGTSSNKKSLNKPASISSIEQLHKDTTVKKQKKEKLKSGETVNINYAGIDELVKIPYVSEKIASAIIDYRNEVGLIKDINELLNIKGIKEKKLAKISVYIRLQD